MGFIYKESRQTILPCFYMAANGLLKVPSLTNIIKKIYLLNDTTTLLNYKDSIGYIRISVPVNAPDPSSSVIVIDITRLPNASTKNTKITSISLKEPEWIGYDSGC